MSLFYVGITDYNWFSVLREDYENKTIGKYVNFWKPGAKEFKSINTGDLFLFKLHKRNDKKSNGNGEIVGGGYFVKYDKMTIADAWNKFGRGNGSKNLETLQQSIYSNNYINNNSEIGCIILENVFFFEQWIDEPIDWKAGIVSGKKYSTDTEIGAELYNYINNLTTKPNNKIIQEIKTGLNDLSISGKEKNALVKIRINQGVFRERLLKKYPTCCLCKVGNPALLIASHIKPWAVSDSEEKLDVNNGFLFCPNHDALFDEGFISFEDNGLIMISEQLNQTDCIFTNVVPTMKIKLSEKNKEYLKYHRENIFKK